MTEKKLVAKLSIEMYSDGSVAVEGPLGNLPMCYGLLELARDEVKAYTDRKRKPEEPRIKPPTAKDIIDINKTGGRG